MLSGANKKNCDFLVWLSRNRNFKLAMKKNMAELLGHHSQGGLPMIDLEKLCGEAKRVTDELDRLDHETVGANSGVTVEQIGALILELREIQTSAAMLPATTAEGALFQVMTAFDTLGDALDLSPDGIENHIARSRMALRALSSAI